MSIGSVGSSSFFSQDQAFFAGQAANTTSATTIASLFGSSAVPSTSQQNTATASTDSMLGLVGTTIMQATENANVLAAQEASARLNAKA